MDIQTDNVVIPNQASRSFTPNLETNAPLNDPDIIMEEVPGNSQIPSRTSKKKNKQKRDASDHVPQYEVEVEIMKGRTITRDLT